MSCELRDGRWWRHGEPWFPVGANYHPSSVGIGMWRHFPEAEIADDLEAMASAGLSLVRIFVYWADLEPAPGELRADVLGRVRRFCELAGARGMSVLISALTVWMNGQRFFPPWLEGRDLWSDPLARQRARAAVAAIVAAAGPTGAVAAYDLGDELPHADPRSFRLSRAEVAAWQEDLAGVVRAGHPGALVTQANEASSVFGRNPFGPDNATGLDFAAVHGYPWWSPPTVGSHRDATASLLVPFLVAWSRAYGPVLVDEIGAYLASAEVTAAHLRASLPSLAAAGALGAVVWSWKDIAAAGPPYHQRPSERRTGLVDTSGAPRPALAAVSRAAEEARAVWSRARRRPAPVALFVGESGRRLEDTYLDAAAGSGGGLGPGAGGDVALFHAYVLCARAHLPAEITTDPAGHHRLIICPCPDRLTERDAEVLAAAVLAGATLLASVGDPGNGLLGPELCGVEVDDFTAGDNHRQFGFAGHRYDLRWPAPARAAVVRSVGAEVVAAFEDRSPALTRWAFHAGTVWLLNAPLERLFTSPGDLAEARWPALYRAVADAAGVFPPVWVDHPEVEVQHLDVDGQEKVLVVNHGWRSVEATVGGAVGAEQRVSLAGKSSVLLDCSARRRLAEVAEAVVR